jgi:hypothetical protein
MHRNLYSSFINGKSESNKDALQLVNEGANYAISIQGNII